MKLKDWLHDQPQDEPTNEDEEYTTQAVVGKNGGGVRVTPTTQSYS